MGLATEVVNHGNAIDFNTIDASAWKAEGRIDISKKYKSYGAEKITVYAENADVIFSAEGQSEISVCISIFKEDQDFLVADIHKTGTVFTISVKGNKERAIVEIKVPKRPFGEVLVDVKKGDIDLKEGIIIRSVELYAKEGKVKSSSIFKSMEVECKDSIGVSVSPICDIDFKIKSIIGTVFMILNRVSISKITSKAGKGTIKVVKQPNELFDATGQIETNGGAMIVQLP